MLWSKPSTTLLKNQTKTQNDAFPTTIAAKQDKTMQIAAKYAQGWESSYLTPEQFVSLNEKFESICKMVNRNVEQRITKSIELEVIISESESDLEYKKRIFAMERGPAVTNQMLKHGKVGTPERIKDRLKQYTDAGVDQFLLAFQDPLDAKSLELLIKAVGR
jgi:alkanesulfonate monooxygenase SsuD/methylene tetrahydromethanopterin reductase-like flavin-dependent oxidoreductase (luciferase family)